MQKASELREKTDEELITLCEEISKDLEQFEINKGTGQATDRFMRVRGMRRDIARIKTIINERGAE